MKKAKIISILLFLFFIISVNPVQNEETKFVGSIKSNKYHYTWCRWAQKIKSENLITFSSVKEAKEAGYIACKVCKPPQE